MKIIDVINQAQEGGGQSAPSGPEQQAEPPRSPGPTSSAGADDPNQTEVSPDDQAVYEKVVVAGLTALNGATDKILQMLSSQADNLPQAIGDVTLMIVQQLDKKAGGKIPRDILFHAALEILANVVEFTLQAGIGDVTKQTQNQAAQRLLIGLAKAYPQEMKAFIQGAVGAVAEMPEEEFGRRIQEQVAPEGQGESPPQASAAGNGLIGRQMQSRG